MLIITQKRELFLRRGMHYKFFDEGKRGGEVAQVKQFDGRVRIAARELDFERGDAARHEVCGGSIGDAARRNSQLVWNACTLRRRDHHLAGSLWQQEARISRPGGGGDEHPLPDASGVG